MRIYYLLFRSHPRGGEDPGFNRRDMNTKLKAIFNDNH